MIASFLIILLVFFLLCSAWMSSSETALFSLSPYTVKAYRSDSDPKKRQIYQLLLRPRELLVTILMLNILVNLLVQNTVSSLFGDFANWGLKVGLPLVLTLFLGEIIPKSLALPNKEALSYLIVRPLSILAKVLFPFQRRLTHITGYISRFLFFFLKKEKEISADELTHLLATSKEAKVITSEEAEIINGYFDLQHETVKGLMRPKEEVLSYNLDEPLSRLIHIFTVEECSRVPVCSHNLDTILGIISSRRYFFNADKIRNPSDLQGILKKPLFVPESMKAFHLLRQFRSKKESIAMVVDEYGTISGLITEEDLVESVIGEIQDRRDGNNRYTRSGSDVIIASGKLELKEIEDIFGITLPKASNVVTIGGWLTEQLGDIPTTGMRYVTDDLLFYILSAEPNRVSRVYIRALKPKKR